MTPNGTNTVLARLADFFFAAHASTAVRIMLVVAAAILAHVLIRLIGAVSEWLVTASHRTKQRLLAVAHKPKFVTFLRLIANTLTSAVYFVAIGLILEEAGVNLAAYMASASVVGLAISFGSQGLVQDTVIGLTLLFSDAMDVDDMVEIAGTVVVVGRVREIGLRFTKIVNLYGQVVFIPNRTIANVSRFPAGGVYAYADVHVPEGLDHAKVEATIKSVTEGVRHQFSALVLEAQIFDVVQQAHEGGWRFVRVRFKVWPGQGQLIETNFRLRMLSAMRALVPDYADWQIPIFYRALSSEHPELAD
jgi:small conductance mechanosensitive channel